MSDYTVLLPDFDIIDPFEARRRVVLAIDGRERQGKTHFCLTCPSPIAYFDFDMGSEGTAEKFAGEKTGTFEHSGKIIIRSKPFIVRPPEAQEEDTEKFSRAEWIRFHEAYHRSLVEPVVAKQGRKLHARTVVIDTGSEMEELLRLAWFGKLVQVPTFKYRERNSIMRDIVRRALDSNVNVIFTHKMSAEWKKTGDADKQGKTGAYERKGFEEMGHLVQANLFAYRCPPPESQNVTWRYKVGTGEAHSWQTEARTPGDNGFRVRILDSRHNPELEGFEWAGESATFMNVACALIQGSTPDDWADEA